MKKNFLSFPFWIIGILVLFSSCKTTQKIQPQRIDKLLAIEQKPEVVIPNQLITSSIADYAENRKNVPSWTKLELTTESGKLSSLCIVTEEMYCIIESMDSTKTIRLSKILKEDNQAVFRYDLAEVPPGSGAIVTVIQEGSPTSFVLWDPELEVSSYEQAKKILNAALSAAEKGDFGKIPVLK